MESKEDQIFEKYGKNGGIVTEILFFHINMNWLAFRVDITYTNESMNSLKYKEKKFYQQIKIC